MVVVVVVVCFGGSTRATTTLTSVATRTRRASWTSWRYRRARLSYLATSTTPFLQRRSRQCARFSNNNSVCARFSNNSPHPTQSISKQFLWYWIDLEATTELLRDCRRFGDLLGANEEVVSEEEWWIRRRVCERANLKTNPTTTTIKINKTIMVTISLLRTNNNWLIIAYWPFWKMYIFSYIFMGRW